jgi:hypothetical protein
MSRDGKKILFSDQNIDPCLLMKIIFVYLQKKNLSLFLLTYPSYARYILPHEDRTISFRIVDMRCF